MAFDLESLKGKLDDETLSGLTAHITETEAKLKTIRKTADSATEKAKSLESAQRALLDRWSVETLDDIELKPQDSANAQELSRQIEAKYESRIKRMERDRDEAVKAREALAADMTQARRSQAIAKAVAAGGFLDNEAAELLLSRSIEQQEDDFVFKTKDGYTIPLTDGAMLLAKERPHLVKAPQGTGSGFRDAGGAAAKKMPQAAFDALRPAERAAKMAEGFVITES